jgi:hypothetical protein
MKTSTGIFAALLLLTPACGGTNSEQTGDLEVILEAEETITDGIAAGTGEEDMRDGWAVEFERFIVSVGNVTVHDARDASVKKSDPASFVVDLATLPSTGTPLWHIDGLGSGRWTFGYAIGRSTDVQRHSSVDRATFNDFTDEKLTYLVEGSLSQKKGVSCPPPDLASVGSAEASEQNGGGVDCYSNPSITFSFHVPAAVKFGPCERDGSEGFAITSGQTRTVAITIHGDHAFFNGFPEGSEANVLRLAQWLADSDLNLDGEVTQAELEAISPSDLWQLDPDRYQLGGSPISPLKTMWDYYRAQLMTQGHFQGEGECEIGGGG